jgi:alpha-L-fucosidase
MNLLRAGCWLVSAVAVLSAQLSIAEGPFKPEWDSLKSHQDPEWFRDAKFGIYTHWGPVTLGREEGPGGGEWYGKEMYETNSRMFAWHQKQFGDQHTVGYKDVIPKFTAAKFDAERWADIFARAGAKFAGPVAVHHDNFAMWDSQVTPWNSTTMGPKRDVTGELAKAYKVRGLKLITTFHHGFAWEYFEPAFRFDAADGKNFLLYTEPHKHGDPPSRRFQDQWLAMVMECVSKYEPDMIWFDFELKKIITPEYEQRMFADYYNWAAARGKESAVAHKFREIHEHTGILDFERGREDKLVPYPWLTDTALGPWFNRNDDNYRSVDNLVHVLIDIVSKNGCMLLNVGPQADGSISERAEKMLVALGDWLRVNGEGIYATRPWKIFGEGPTRGSKGGGFSENADRDFTPRDIRFTQSKDGASLYAITLGVPSEPICIRSLAAAAGRVTAVSLLGGSAPLSWSQTAEGLSVTLPEAKPCAYAIALKIAGESLQPVAAPAPDTTVRAGADGRIVLTPAAAQLHGDKIRTEEARGHEYIAAWDNPADWPSWKIAFPAKADYEVQVVYSAAAGDTRFSLELAGAKIAGQAAGTQGWYDYATLSLGRVSVGQAGAQELTLRADPQAWKPLNVREIRLLPVK